MSFVLTSRRLRAILQVSAAMLGAQLAAACSSLFAGGNEACPQTGEFANHGCARVLVLLEVPPQPWPTIRWSVRASAADTLLGLEAFGAAPIDLRVSMEVTLWTPLPEAAGDTASFWVSVRMLEVPSPVPVGEPLPVFAADSVLRRLTFAEVGDRPAMDTVRLVPKSG